MIRPILNFFVIFLSNLFNISKLNVCRFEPSCTRYAKQALDTHPSFYALLLVTKRLLRCRPFGPSGYDPVPASHQKMRLDAKE